MNEDIKRDWVAALRSGKYKQGANLLRSTDDKYCCLGVLCALAAKSGVIDRDFPILTGDFIRSYAYGPDGEDNIILPEAVREWAGLAERGPAIDGWDLTSLNDGGYAEADFDYENYQDALSFSQIADRIEASDL